jgi:cytosine/adenosine deaminase-related metal-dependent hydrolase
MYLLTIRDGLHTRHIGPYASPKQAADDLDQLLRLCGERARWQIHALESPDELLARLEPQWDGAHRVDLSSAA